MTLPKFLVLFVSSLSLAACGGGGSSSDGGSGSGGAGSGTSNAAPIVNISISDTSPNEGLTISLDASGSTDSDGDTLSFTWTQLSGPDLSFSATSGSEIAVTVPNLTADTSARVQLSVSDGAVATTDEVTLNLTNVVLSPETDLGVTTEKQIDYPNRVSDIFYQDYNFQNLIYEEGEQVVIDGLGYDQALEPSIVSARKASIDRPNQFTRQMPPLINGDYGFTAIYDDRVDFYDISANFEYSHPTSDACAVLNVDDTQDLSSALIGKSDRATIANFSISGGGLTSVEATDLEIGRSFCEMAFLFNSINSGGGAQGKVLTFDRSINELILYNIEYDGFNFSGLSRITIENVSLDIPSGTNLELIAAEPLTGLGLALAFSDGVADGEHRLVVAGVGQNGLIYQQSYSWDYGTPEAIHWTQNGIGNSNSDNLVIQTSDSPYAVVFQAYTETVSLGGGSPFGTPAIVPVFLPLTEPSYYHFGLGVDQIGQFSWNSATGFGVPDIWGLVATYPDEGLVKVFER